MSERSAYFDQNGQPITLEQWSEAFTDFETRRIAYDEIGDATVTTVWHGCDYSMTDPPRIFGTLVQGGALNGLEREYATKDDALQGHKSLVQQITGIV